MSAANLIAFEVALTTTYVRLSDQRLVANVTLFNQHSTNYVHISMDGGATKSLLNRSGSVTLQGVDLYDVWVASNAASGTVLSVTGNTRS